MLHRCLLIFLLVISCMVSKHSSAQTADDLLKKVKSRLEKVMDYAADGNMKMDVDFIRIPDAKVKVYFRQPDQFRVIKENGISLLPKGGLSISLNALLSGKEFVAVSGGTANAAGRSLSVVKLLPIKENSEIVLATLYIDAASALVYRTVATTRDNGTFETQLSYGKYADQGLPDEVVFLFNTSAYKLPKGITMEYQGSKKPADRKTASNGQGKISIRYERYVINKGVPDSIFK